MFLIPERSRGRSSLSTRRLGPRAARPALAAVVAVAAALSAPPAFADDKAACLESYVQAQKLRQDAKLRAALKELAICTRDACPGAIKADCSRWQADSEQAIPSVVFSARGADGVEITDVTVKMDDEVLTQELKGTSIPVDPGSHRFRFERAGVPPQETTAVILEGEKRRKIEITFAGPKPAPAAAPGAAAVPQPAVHPDAPAPPASSGGARPIPVTVFVAGGVGLAALGGALGFGLSAMSSKSDLDLCKPRCSTEQLDDVKSTFLVSDVLLGVGIASLGVATILFLTRPEVSSAPRASAGAFPRREPARRPTFDVRGRGDGVFVSFGGAL